VHGSANAAQLLAEAAAAEAAAAAAMKVKEEAGAWPRGCWLARAARFDH
jgi:hypothetical protein